MGAGSDFHVERAIAVGGQIVRIVFSIEPKHASTAGLDDARNASNYEVTIVTGTGRTLQSLSAKPDLAFYPAFGVLNAGEVGVDLQLDRPMVVGMSYQVQASVALRSQDGHAIGSPYSATFVGAARPIRTRQVRRRLGLVDLASDPFKGGITVDSSGDWARHEGLPATRKRVWRIPLTRRGSFAWIYRFGLAYDIKKPATLSILTNLRTDLRQQIAQQPDVVSSESLVAMDSRGFLEMTIRAKTSSGELLDNTIKATQDGVMKL